MSDAPSPPAPHTGSPTSGPPPAAPALRPRRAETVLGRLTRAVREQNWFAVALELVIVVVGIVIGFQVTAWGQAQQARRVETESLRALRAALANDLEDVRSNAAYHGRFAASAEMLQRHLAAGGPYADTLDVHFGRVMGVTYSVQDRTAYETLKQRGLETITDGALRAEVGRLYGVRYPTVVEFQDRTSSFVFDNVLPYYTAHFRDLVPTQRATPVDYAALAASTEYAVLVDWAAYLHPILVASLLQLEEDVVGLIALLDRELGAAP
ncbi:hypothetical protein [Rubrivirga sp. IMCC45206]|uniref:hypothetical protein n=1 Tax=Rubrivirga sp. IMCC45206 TaxID=3391614 RepID=UPI0039903990